MAWTFSDDFNSYSDGNLNGQGSWSGSTTYQIQGVTVYEGAKAVKSIGANANIDRSITSVSSGVMYFTMMKPDTTQDAAFRLVSGASIWMQISFSAGNILLFDGTGNPTTLVTGYTTGTFYIFEVTIISTSQLSLRYRAVGSAWSASTGTRSSSVTGSVDKIQLNQGGSGTAYWDYISPLIPFTIVPTQGSYAYTGETVNFIYGHILSITRGVYTYTGFIPSFSTFPWQSQSKNITDWSAQNKSH